MLIMESLEKKPHEVGQLSSSTNNDPLTNSVKEEIINNELLFLGTFYHETGDECQCDLVQFKGPVHISEIRVIPLGAKVKLSNGTYQLGATNPSKLELEFFFNNLTEPENTTFGLIQRFDFDDKTHIQLKCTDNKKVITDGIVVRGLYSTISLGVYGVHVDHVEVISAPKRKASPVKVEPDHHLEELSPTTLPSEIENDTIGKKLDDSKSPVDELESEAEVKSISVDNEPEEFMDTDRPQAIPTISTRVNFGSIGSHANDQEAANETMMDTDDFDQSKIAKTSPIDLSSPSAVIIETEDISDGEVPSTDDDNDDEQGKREIHRSSESLISSGPKSPFVNSSADSIPPLERPENGTHDTSLVVSPQHDQLSEQDDLIFPGEFPEPGVEEILSDEEMSEFIECDDYGEWEEYWSRKFTRSFNPFSENFTISPLQNFTLEAEYLKDTASKKPLSADAALEKLLPALEKYPVENFNSQSMEEWISTGETLIPIIPIGLAALPEGEKIDKIVDDLLYWAKRGTDLDLASTHSNLANKVRHIKLGIRQIHNLTMIGGSIGAKVLEYQFSDDPIGNPKNVQQRLLDILTRQYMGISTQLVILRALDSTLNTKIGYEKFVKEVDRNGQTCFQRLIEFSIMSNLSSRISYSLRSFLNKLRVMESISLMHDMIGQLISREVAFESCSDEFMNHLQFLLNIAVNVDQTLAHPVRMFPVGALMEMPSNSFGLSPKSLFVKALEETKFMKICAVILCWKDVPVEIVAIISDLISCMLTWEIGLVYFTNEGESSLIVIKALMMWEEEGSNSVGLFGAHCVEIMKCLDIISELGKVVQDPDEEEDLPAWQTLYSFLSTTVPRRALVHTLSMGDNIMPLFKCVKPSEAEPCYLRMSRLERSARKGYATEIIAAVIKNTDSITFLKQHGNNLHKIITSLSEEGDGCDKLNELLPFLKLGLNPKHFSFDGIESLCETVTAKSMNFFQSASAEDNWGIPQELTTAIRILAALGVPNYDDDITVTLKTKDNDFYIKELKYTMSLVRMHSLDSITSFVKIIHRICDEFSQPAVYNHLFVGSRGDALVNLLLPLIKLLRSLLTLVIQTRKTEFRDVTAIPALIQLHALMESFPTASLNYIKSQEIRQHVIAILLAYTVPALKVGEETEEELKKSPWTALISETLKFTLSAPNTFVAGLTIISELLPLPLPMAARQPLDETECSLGIKMRRLWSAYLHYLSPQIQEMIGTLCGSTHGRLISILKRVCLQLADLSASTCLVVVRAILDAITVSVESDYEQQVVEENSNPPSVKAWVETVIQRPPLQCSPHTSRLLGFLTSLVANAPIIKGGLTQALRGVSKIDEKYSDYLPLLTTVVTSNSGQSDSECQSSGSATQTQPSSEVLLRTPDLLSDVYAQRTVFVLLDNENMDACSSFLLTSVPPAFDLEMEQQDSDLIHRDLTELVHLFLGDVDIAKEIESLCKLFPLKEDDKKGGSKSGEGNAKSSDDMHMKHSLLGIPPRKMTFNSSLRGGPSSRGGFGRILLPGPGRGGNILFDPFRSRPPNTSRPPSLHVDDFVALESSGQNTAGVSSYKGGMRGGPNEPFTNRNRGSLRGSSRPYGGGNNNDRSRQIRSSPSLNIYYQPQRNEANLTRGRYGNTPPRGRGGYNSGNDRWSADGRGVVSSSSSTFSRQQEHIRSINNDKFRPGPSSGGGSGSGNRSALSSRPSSYSRNSYRDSPPNRTGTERWREKPR